MFKNSIGLRKSPESLGRRTVEALGWGEELSRQSSSNPLGKGSVGGGRVMGRPVMIVMIVAQLSAYSWQLSDAL